MTPQQFRAAIARQCGMNLSGHNGRKVSDSEQPFSAERLQGSHRHPPNLQSSTHKTGCAGLIPVASPSAQSFSDNLSGMEASDTSASLSRGKNIGGTTDGPAQPFYDNDDIDEMYAEEQARRTDDLPNDIRGLPAEEEIYGLYY